MQKFRVMFASAWRKTFAAISGGLPKVRELLLGSYALIASNPLAEPVQALLASRVKRTRPE
jgi:hypothetical protein